MKRFRLAVLSSHPIQYQAPLWRYLAAHEAIDLTVYFLSRRNLEPGYDIGFAREIYWDQPLLDGYSHIFLRNLSPRSSQQSFWGCTNPGVLAALSPARHDAVLIHGWFGASNWLGFGAAWARRLPVLLRSDANLDVLQRGRTRAKRLVLPHLFRRVDAFLFGGSKNRAFYESLGVRPERLFFMPFAVDNDAFQASHRALVSKKAELRRRWGLPENALVAVFVGKLAAHKRAHDLLEAAAQVGDTRLAVLFVGDGVLRRGLEARARTLAMESVHFVGFQNLSRIPEFYALADVLVLPSSFESWGLVVNEAMNFALPILASEAVGAVGDLVREGENGFTFPVGDVACLARHLQRLLQQPNLLSALGRCSAETIARWSFRQDAEGLLAAARAVTSR